MPTVISNCLNVIKSTSPPFAVGFSWKSQEACRARISFTGALSFLNMTHIDIVSDIEQNKESMCMVVSILVRTRLITMRSKPDYVEFVL